MKRFTTSCRAFVLGTMAVAALAAGGCASGPERPDEAIARAEASVAQADQAGARQYGGAEFDQARDKLNNARRLADSGKNAAAGPLAEQAEADADLAAARARRQSADKAAQEIAAATQTLQQELNRQQAAPAQP